MKQTTTTERGESLLPAILESWSTEVSRAGMLNIHGFVLREGTAFQSGRLNADEHEVVTAAIAGMRFETGSCFTNAQRVLENDPTGRLIYVEGYHLTGQSPTLHAWLAIGDRVVDPTAMPPKALVQRALASKRRPRSRTTFGVFPKTQEYYGVRFDRGFVGTTIQENMVAAMRRGDGGYATTMLDDWAEGHRIVKQGAAGWRHVPTGGKKP